MSAPDNALADHFRFAQSPVMWLLTALALLESAAQNYHAAAEQAERYARAEHEATTRANAKIDAESLESAVEPIDAAEPKFLPAFMLYGFALENLLKGIIVMNDPTRIRDKRIGVPRIHNLVSLADIAGVSLTEDENRLLDALTTITEWSGRYPVALDLTNFQPIGIDRDSVVRRHADVHARVVAFAHRLRASLSQFEPRQRGGVIVVWRE